MKEISYSRKTLRGPVIFEGKGLHSGSSVTVKVSAGDAGIVFKHNGQETTASPENVTRTQLCTCLGEISTIEHLMSAFAGLGITDANVELTAPELPALDGASLKYSSDLAQVGFETLGTQSMLFTDDQIYVVDGITRIEVKLGTGRIQYTFASGDRWPKVQSYLFHFNSTEDYINEIAPARTFCFEEQVSQILSAGMGLGLDQMTALIIGQKGYVNDPKFIDEPARHKILDLMGDLYIAGVPLNQLDIVAKCSGHTSNTQMAAEIAKHSKKLSAIQ